MTGIWTWMRAAFCATVALVVLTGCGQGDSVEQRVAEARKRHDGPAIWKVTDYNSTLYLFGTVHLLPDGADWQRNDLQAAFDDVGTAFFEIPDDAEANLQATLLQQQYGLYPSGQRLTDFLDNSNLNRLTAAAHNAKLRPEQIAAFKPWLVSDILGLAAAESEGLKAENSADAVLRRKASEDGKVVKYLDDMRTYIEAVALQPDYVQLRALEGTIKNYDKIGADIKTVNGAWIVGNVDLLQRDLMDAARDKSPEMFDVLFTKRNQKWAKTLDGFLQGDDKGIVVVGVGHLLGAEGLPVQFRELGYDVERMKRFDLPNN